MADRVEVHGLLVEVEAVGHADGDHERPRGVGAEVDRGAHALGRRAGPEVVQPDGGGAGHDGQVVGVPTMDVDASEDVLLRANPIPLRRNDAGLPGSSVQLGKDAALASSRVGQRSTSARRLSSSSIRARGAPMQT